MTDEQSIEGLATGQGDRKFRPDIPREDVQRLADKLRFDLRAALRDKWDKILQPDNLAQIPGTPAWRALHEDGQAPQRRSLTAQEAQNIVGTAAYYEANPVDRPDAWAKRFSEELAAASALVEKAKTGAREANLNKTNEPSTIPNFQTSFEEVAEMLRAVNPNKYAGGLDKGDPRVVTEVNNLVYAMNRKGGDSTFDMLKDMVMSRRQKNT